MLNIPFWAYCVFTVALAAATVAGIAPLLWDAAGAIETILNNLYVNLPETVER